jgi:hypothetical protein
MGQHSAWILVMIGIALARAQVRDSALHPDYTAHLEVVVQRGDTGEVAPARIYLFRSGEAHRLSPVDNLLPLVQDNFYRNRIWRMTDRPKTLEITIRGISHVILLEGRATFDVPAGKEYRLEAYHGLFYTPVWSENWICMKMRYFATAARRSR